MSLSNEAKKWLCESLLPSNGSSSLQQQCLNQKSAEYNEAKRLFMGLTDLDYKPGHKEHTFYKYWLASRPEGATLKGHGHTSSSDRNDTALLDAYQPEEIYSQYIIRIKEKFALVNHPSEVYRIPDTHECIDGNQPLRLIIDIDARQKPDPTNPKVPSLDDKKITREDLLSRILVACADVLSLIPDCMPFLNSFALASSSNAEKCSWHIVYPRAQFIDYRELKGFTVKVMELVGEPYSKFIDIGLPKTHFNLRLIGSAKEGRIKRPAISSIKNGFKNLDDYLVQPKENYSVIWPRTFSSEEPVKQESHPIDDENALSRGANLVIEKYGWLQIGKIGNGFINFQAQSIKECPICDVKHDKDQLYGFIRKNGYFILKCYRQKQYKPEHKGLSFGKVSDKVESKVKPKLGLGLNERIAKAVLNPRLLPELSGEVINVKEMEDFPEAYPNFLSKEPSTTLIRSPMMTGKTKGLRKYLNYLAKNKANMPCVIWISYRKTLSNESMGKINDLKLSGLRICNYQDEQSLSVDKWDIIIVQVESLSRIEFSARPIVAILDEVNAIQRQMNSGSNARESENAMRDVLRSAQHVLAMDAFANESTLTFLKAYRGENIRVIDNKFQPLIGKTVEYLYDPNSGAEAMRIGFEFLRQGKRVAFVVSSSNMARALVKEASKLSFKARAYYGDMDGKQRKKDFLDINTAWGELDCVAYTNTVEAGISFEKPNHFDIVIGITNTETPVNVEAFIQMMFRIRDCEKRILSLYYQKISNELSRSPGHENIRAELAIARPNEVPTAIKGHREWDKDIVSYKLDQSSAVTSFIEVEHRKRLSARNFIEISCSLIASTGASLKLIKMDESRGAIGIRKKVRNEIRAKVSVIKHTDFDAVATSRNLTHEEAEFLKLDSERSVADTMALKRFYMWNLYGGNSMSIEDWNKLCNKDFVEHFSPPEPRKHFLRLSHFYKQGYDEESAIEELKAKDIAQWEDTCYNTKDNFVDSVAKDLRKTYSANHWEAVRGLLQSLGFTGIDDKRILSDDQVKVTFEASRDRFIEIRSQALLLFGFNSRAKEIPDLNSAIKAINAIVGNWCGYTIKSKRKLVGSKGQQIWKYSYQINRNPYKGRGFDNQEEIIAIKIMQIMKFLTHLVMRLMKKPYL
ncbi:helicase [Gigaspora margarita]|uniref:Helicase n=1 Tax=Gigaspora margarita TaxID=4874 RepID=A0A8H3XIJ2_GIGMA|nr:helicase [Gigaspora margarita]